MTHIYHITTHGAWEQAQTDGQYTAPSFQSEGFIHCSTSVQVLQVANAFYRDVPHLVLLCIEPDRLLADLKWEAPAHPAAHADAPSDAQLFPHVYGAINLDAVAAVVDFPQSENGFSLPQGI
jgi:uncharacterized protein (DUF952 family)